MGVLFDVNTSRMVASTAAVLACAVIGDRGPRPLRAGRFGIAPGGGVDPVGHRNSGQQVHIRCPFGHRHGGGQAVRISARGTYFGRQSFATIAATGLLCGLPFYVATIATLFRLYDLDLTNEGLTMPAAAALVGCRFGALGYLLAGTPQLAPSQQSPAGG